MQTEHTLTGIRVLFALAPAGFAVLNVIALLFYPLADSQVKQIEEDLARRKAGAA